MHVLRTDISSFQSRDLAAIAQQQRPVLIEGGLTRSAAHARWTPDYFKDRAPAVRVRVKRFQQGKVLQQVMPIGEYVELMQLAADEGRKVDWYCHDVPIFALVPGLERDVEGFPVNILPGWYRQGWWDFAQFFMGPPGTVTPMHFDTLLTHNLFVQVRGAKRFTLVEHEDAVHCGRKGWRWFDLDPDADGFAATARTRNIRHAQVTVNGGDILYIPPGMLHHVRALDESISFNVDFHTARSACGALARSRRAPRINHLYNVVSLLGVGLGVPKAALFGLYKSYLSYVS